jgi:tRNA-splicing ligase RtcB (3'-phosphate/5'-hydroxy nucleic acid ligase)
MGSLEYRDEEQWKRLVTTTAPGELALATRDTGDVPVRLFLGDTLFRELEPTIYRQIVNATRFPGAKLVVITPDAHFGYGVPVGCVILTDRDNGALAMGPVGFDIGCGMVSARSAVPWEKASPDRKRAFHEEVLRRVDLGPGGASKMHGSLSRAELQDLVRGGAEHYVDTYGSATATAGAGAGAGTRQKAERNRIPVDDDWDIPFGGPGSPERGLDQLGTLGGGNHFIELQRCEETKTLFVQIHTGSRGFGHGLATNYFAMAKDEQPDLGSIDLGSFLPGSRHHRGYQNAVAAGGNFAIVNRLVLFDAVAEAFRKVFKADLELVYEISHNLVQAETHPEFGEVWAHRKGATRAFPAHHPALVGTPWEEAGHPVLIPGSNRDFSYILRPLPGAARSGYSVNHGAGRRLSRGEATRVLSQEKVNEQYRRDDILVNLDGEVPLDEASACYKSSDEVIAAVTAAGLARVEYTLWPLGSLKDSDSRKKAVGRDRKEQKKDREKARGESRRAKVR